MIGQWGRDVTWGLAGWVCLDSAQIGNQKYQSWPAWDPQGESRLNGEEQHHWVRSTSHTPDAGEGSVWINPEHRNFKFENKKGRKISITNILLCFRSIIFFEVIGSQNRVRDQQPGYRLGAFGSADSQALCGPTEWVALWAGGTHQPWFSPAPGDAEPREVWELLL